MCVLLCEHFISSYNQLIAIDLYKTNYYFDETAIKDLWLLLR